MEALRGTGLVKRFETTAAVDGVAISMTACEVRGLLGPNGAGKTTLLRMLFGLVTPDAGRVELLGRPFDASALAGVAGFVEEPSFYPYLSGRANLELLAELDGEPPGPSIEEALERVDLTQRAGDRAGRYSTGMPAAGDRRCAAALAAPAPPRRAGERARPGGGPGDRLARARARLGRRGGAPL